MINQRSAQKLTRSGLAFHERDLCDAISVQEALRGEGFRVPFLDRYKRELRAVVGERCLRAASSRRARFRAVA